MIISWSMGNSIIVICTIKVTEQSGIYSNPKPHTRTAYDDVQHYVEK